MKERIEKIFRNRKFQKIYIGFVVTFLFFSILLYLFSKNYGINVTKSLPIGIYRIYRYKGEELKKGDLVIYRLPSELQNLSSLRGTEIPTMKEIVATDKDKIEIRNFHIFINGEDFGEINQNEKLPKFNGILKKGEFLTLSKELNSFDGRYYGGIRKEQVLGKGKLVYEFTK